MSARSASRSWNSGKRRRGAIAAALATACAPVALVAVSGPAEAKAPAIFNGSAAAYGVRAIYKINGVPLTKTPFDGGGPTAQAAVDSGVGNSTGYAASPDPGEIFASGPGLVAGVIGGGVPGVLPPVTGLPSLPEYPLLVRSDASANPQVSAGQDPIKVSAESTPAASRSQATFGVESSGSGGGAISTASVGHTPDGAGSATASSDLRGVTVGPLTLGHVLSKVTKTLKPDGTVVPSTTLEVSGARISGTPVEFSPDGFTDLNAALQGVLEQSGVQVEFVAAQEYPESGRVIAPGLKVTMPIPQSPQIPGVGQFSGTATYFIGFATAEITPPGGVQGAASSVGDTSRSSITPAVGAPISGAPTSSEPAASAPLPTTAVEPAGSPMTAYLNQPAADVAEPAGAVLSSSAASAQTLDQLQPVAVAEFEGKDLRSVYLLAVAAVVAAIAAGLRIVRPGAAT